MFGFLDFPPFWIAAACLGVSIAYGYARGFRDEDKFAASVAWLSAAATVAFMAAQW